MLVLFRWFIPGLLLLINLIVTAAAENEWLDELPSKLDFPRRIPLFNSVSFHIAQASFLQIRYMNCSICSLNAMGNATFPCRCFGFPSDHYELLVDNLSKIKFSVVAVQKFWKVPEESISCQPLVVELDSDILCKELNLSQQLQYSPIISTTKIDDLKFTSEVEVALEKSVILPCQRLCLPGIYRIVLMNGETAVQVSKPIRIHKTNEISVNLPRPHIFPRCFDYLKISWNNLSCPIHDLDFKMRLFAVPEGSNFEQSYYAEEYDIDLSEQALELPCYQFDIIYAQFCFEIVSVQKRTARLTEWARQCVYTEDLRQIEGGWRDWSTWSSCSVSCGRGFQRRWRLCDSPAPENGGNICEGQFIEAIECDAGKCNELITAAALDAVNDTLCFCGCVLNNEAGRFFARTCGNATTDWTLKPFGRFLNIKLNRDSTISKFRLRIYRDLKKKELVYDSEKSPILESIFHLTSDSCFVISLLNLNGSSSSKSLGIEISYEWTNESEVILPSKVFKRTNDYCVLCYSNLSILLAALFVVLILLIPPFLCFYVTLIFARRAQRRRNRQINIDRSLDRSRFDLNMIRSGQTDTTEIKSNRTVITKRSIGIQLSASSTPRFPHYRGIFWSRGTNSPQMTPRNGEHSSLSFSTDHDLEYDYYEPAIPGSFLTPATDFHSDIDIEQIIGSSELSRSIVSRHDAHTQVDDT